MIWSSSRKIPGMDGQTKTLIQLDASQLIYLWRLAWLCQIAAYVRQQSTEPATPEPKPLQGKKSPEQSCTKGKPLATGCCIKGKVPSVRRCTSSVPIFANGATTVAFSYLFSNAANSMRSTSTSDAKDPTKGSGWFRPKDHIYTVGRRGHDYVYPGPKPGVGKFIDDYWPGGHTFGTDHDAFVNHAVNGLGMPDLLVNIPSMPFVYVYSVGKELINTPFNLFGVNQVPFKHAH
ncbi:MAG: hypothetical protein ABW168_29370 [Sedimenticola sp.]